MTLPARTISVMGTIRRGFETLQPLLFGGGAEGLILDPSDLSTMFQDTAGTTPVTADGQLVARINDKSGNGNNATQATEASRPTYRTDGTLHWLEFDGVDDFMVTSTITPGTDKAQVFTGVQKQVDSSTRAVASFGATASGSWEMFAPRSSAASQRYGFAHRTNIPVEAFGANGAAPDTAVLSGLSDLSAPFVSLRRNGILQQSNTSALSAANYGSLAITIGARSGTLLFLDGRVMSLIVRFGPNLDAATVNVVERYIATKSGVTL